MLEEDLPFLPSDAYRSFEPQREQRGARNHGTCTVLELLTERQLDTDGRTHSGVGGWCESWRIMIHSYLCAKRYK